MEFRYSTTFKREACVIMAGEYHVGFGDRLIETVLGSCVAVCLWDQTNRIGGMNHFMLPGEDTSLENVSGRYGLYSMELLINDMMHRGSRRSLLAAKVFGAGSVMAGVAKERSVSTANEKFVLQLLGNEGIPIACADLGGESGRRIAFFLDTGKVKVRRLGQSEVGRVQAEESRYRMKQVQAIKAPREMEVELF
jgi:chemotaxis protein CheD